MRRDSLCFRRPRMTACLWLCAVLTLASCGQTGPLALPDRAAPEPGGGAGEEAAAPGPAPEDAEDEDTDAGAR